MPRVAEVPKNRRMLTQESSMLKRAAKSRAARWLAGAAMLLSVEGCGTAFNEYRREVNTDFSFHYLPQTGSGGSDIGMARVTFSETTPEERVRMAEREGDSIFRHSSDQLVANTPAGPMLNVEALAGRWWLEMEPHTVYLGSDGHRYTMFGFRRDASSYASTGPQQDMIPDMELSLDTHDLSPESLANRIQPPALRVEAVPRPAVADTPTQGGDPGQRRVVMMASRLMGERTGSVERLEVEPRQDPANPYPSLSEFMSNLQGERRAAETYVLYLVRSRDEHQAELNRYANEEILRQIRVEIAQEAAREGSNRTQPSSLAQRTQE